MKKPNRIRPNLSQSAKVYQRKSTTQPESSVSSHAVQIRESDHELLSQTACAAFIDPESLRRINRCAQLCGVSPESIAGQFILRGLKLPAIEAILLRDEQLKFIGLPALPVEILGEPLYEKFEELALSGRMFTSELILSVIWNILTDTKTMPKLIGKKESIRRLIIEMVRTDQFVLCFARRVVKARVAARKAGTMWTPPIAKLRAGNTDGE